MDTLLKDPTIEDEIRAIRHVGLMFAHVHNADKTDLTSSKQRELRRIIHDAHKLLQEGNDAITAYKDQRDTIVDELRPVFEAIRAKKGEKVRISHKDRHARKDLLMVGALNEFHHYDSQKGELRTDAATNKELATTAELSESTVCRWFTRRFPDGRKSYVFACATARIHPLLVRLNDEGRREQIIDPHTLDSIPAPADEEDEEDHGE